MFTFQKTLICRAEYLELIQKYLILVRKRFIYKKLIEASAIVYHHFLFNSSNFHLIQETNIERQTNK